MTRILVGLALTTFFLGSTAFAADMAVKAPVAPAAATWAGWYVGINGGGAWGRTDPNLVVSPDNYFLNGNFQAVQAAGSQSFNNSGGLVGGQIGYLTQLNSIIVGAEAGFDWMGIKSSSTANVLYPVQGCVQAAGCAFSLAQTTKTDWLFTLLARIGVDMGSWYPYVTGGLAVADIKYSIAFSDNNLGFNATTAASFSRTEAAPAIGGGLEWRWTSNWSVRAEYLYIPFAGPGGVTPQLTSLVPPFPFQTNYVVSEKLRENIARAAVDYRF